MSKELFKITILDEDKEHTTVYATSVTQADFLGFVEISGIEFPNQSDIILTPGEDKAHSLFKDTKRIIIPGNYIIRIEELKEDKKAQIINIFDSVKN